MISMRKFVSPEFIFGWGSRVLAAQYIANMGVKKVFVVSDDVVSKQPWYTSIIESLENEQLEYESFTGVTVNPKDYECVKGAESFCRSGAEVILAIGGGSVMDCSKAIGILAVNPGPIQLYEGVDEISVPIPPLICIPTTSGSAADISQFAIITHTEENYKMAIVSKTLVPDLSLVDPEVTMTNDFDTTIDCGLDVLAHAIESYVSNASSSFTKIHSMEAIKIVLTTLPQMAKDLSNKEYRSQLMQASVHAGLAFSNASLGLIHAMAHGMGGRFNLIHGELNGILLPAVCGYNDHEGLNEYNEINRRFEKICGYSEGSIESYLKDFISAIRQNRSLSTLNIDREHFGELIPWILNDPCILTNPREVTEEGIWEVYEKIK